jgi:hypothetical protein
LLEWLEKVEILLFLVSLKINLNIEIQAEEPGTLTVAIEIQCEATNGTPSNQAVCEYATNSFNYPIPGDYPVSVTGNNPSPTSFPGSSSGTEVTIGAGDYSVVVTALPNTAPLANELDADSLSQTQQAFGDCIQNPNDSGYIGTMTAGGSQECTIVFDITINGGTVPG